MAGQVYYDLHDLAPEPAKLAAINESIRRMVCGAQPAQADDTKKTRRLYDYSYELWYRDGGQQSAKSPAGQPVLWSRGNGWALAAHAKVLARQPGIDGRWPEYRYNLEGLARALAKTQRADGFLGYVQGVGYAPLSSQPVTAAGTADFGVGGFLLAAAELAKLAA